MNCRKVVSSTRRTSGALVRLAARLRLRSVSRCCRGPRSRPRRRTASTSRWPRNCASCRNSSSSCAWPWRRSLRLKALRAPHRRRHRGHAQGLRRPGAADQRPRQRRRPHSGARRRTPTRACGQLQRRDRRAAGHAAGAARPDRRSWRRPRRPASIRWICRPPRRRRRLLRRHPRLPRPRQRPLTVADAGLGQGRLLCRAVHPGALGLRGRAPNVPSDRIGEQRPSSTSAKPTPSRTDGSMPLPPIRW